MDQHLRKAKDKQEKPILLLTGSVTPNSVSYLKIKDPELRRQQYINAINFYLTKTDFKIVFAENSGDSLKNFPMVSDRIEYISFRSSPNYPDRGIGYKEVEIIEFAFINSKLLRSTTSVIKITGRLKILNINRLSKKFLRLRKNHPNLVYANIFKKKNMDSRCFFFTSNFWPYLKEMGQNIDHDYNFESSLWDAAYNFQLNKENLYISLDTPIRVKGISGSFGVRYKHNIVYHYARTIRSLTSRIIGRRSI